MAISDTGPVKEREFYRNDAEDTRENRLKIYIILDQ